MGLCIVARSLNYYYDDDCNEIVEEYYSVNCGYGSFKRFRDDLVSFYSNGKIKSLDELYNNYLYTSLFKNRLGEPCLDLTWLEQKLNKSYNQSLKKYYDFLVKIQSISTDLFNCLPILLHSDCDGSMSYKNVEMIKPLIERFFKENPNKDYGYSAKDYSWKQDFIVCLECVIEKKGMLEFV